MKNTIGNYNRLLGEIFEFTNLNKFCKIINKPCNQVVVAGIGQQLKKSWEGWIKLEQIKIERR